MGDEKLSWKEKFAAIVLISIGVILLVLQAVSIASNKDSMVSNTENLISIKKSELFDHLRFFLTSILALAAGTLLYKQKKWGWIIGVPFLLFSTFIAAYFIYFLFIMAFTANLILMIIGFLLLLVSLLFLLLPSARRKYKVGKRTYLPTLVFLMAICALFFFLQ